MSFSWGSVLSGVSEAFNLTDIVGDLLQSTGFAALSSGSFINTVASGAVVNAALSAVADGDIGQSALYGAFGGAASNSYFDQYLGNMGGANDYAGAAISGFGLDKSTGGNGLLGAGSGMLGQYLGDTSEKAQDQWTPKELAANKATGVVPQTDGTRLDQLTSEDSKFGSLMSKSIGSGENKTTVGGMLLENAVGGVAQMGADRTTEDRMEKASSLRQEDYDHKSDTDAAAEQDRIGFFTRENPFKVKRTNRSAV